MKSSNTKKVYVYTVKSLFILRAAKNQKYAEKVGSWKSLKSFQMDIFMKISFREL